MLALLCKKLWVQSPTPYNKAWGCIPGFSFQVILSYISRLRANLGYMKPKALALITKTPPKMIWGIV